MVHDLNSELRCPQVGGNTGDTAIALAKAAPNLHITVQDLPEPTKLGQASLPAELKDRIDFQPHNFLTPNPVHGADIYLLRFIIHDWPDQDALTILRNIIPCMSPGSRILIADSVMVDSSKVSPMREKFSRFLDVIMMALYNAKERNETQWRDLIKAADPQLQITRIIKPVGSGFELIEVKKGGT